MDEVLRLEGVSFVYGEGTPFRKVALDDVSVSFERGKITGLTAFVYHVKRKRNVFSSLGIQKAIIF